MLATYTHGLNGPDLICDVESDIYLKEKNILRPYFPLNKKDKFQRFWVRSKKHSSLADPTIIVSWLSTIPQLGGLILPRSRQTVHGFVRSLFIPVWTEIDKNITALFVQKMALSMVYPIAHPSLSGIRSQT